MKTKIFLFLALAAIAVSCSTDEPKAFKIDPLATVNIKPAVGTPLKVRGINTDAVQHLTALQIVEQTFSMEFIMRDGRKAGRGFDVGQRDLSPTNPMLKMWGTDVLYYEQLIDGTFTDKLVLSPDFIEASDCVLATITSDTIAYVPNSALRTAETQIKALWEAKNYEPIYKVFHDAYTFIPITGAEWRALKAAGQN